MQTNLQMKKSLYYSLISLVIVLLFVLSYDVIFNTILESEHSTLDVNNTTIQFILLITGIITIVMLFVNYYQQKKQFENNDQDAEFNKIVLLIQNQLLFTNNILKDKSFYNSDVFTINKVDSTLAGYYYDVIEKVYFQVKLYDKFLQNNLTLYDRKIIFSIISTNFLDDYIKEIIYISGLIYSEFGDDDTYFQQELKNILYLNYGEIYKNQRYEDSNITLSKTDLDNYYGDSIIQSYNKILRLKKYVKEIELFYNIHAEITINHNN